MTRRARRALPFFGAFRRLVGFVVGLRRRGADLLDVLLGVLNNASDLDKNPGMWQNMIWWSWFPACSRYTHRAVEAVICQDGLQHGAMLVPGPSVREKLYDTRLQHG